MKPSEIFENYNTSEFKKVVERQEKEPWEKVTRNAGDFHTEAPVVHVSDVRSLLDTQRAEIVKEVEKLKFPEIKHAEKDKMPNTELPTADQSNVYQQFFHNQALDSVIEKIKNK